MIHRRFSRAESRTRSPRHSPGAVEHARKRVVSPPCARARSSSPSPSLSPSSAALPTTASAPGSPRAAAPRGSARSSRRKPTRARRPARAPRIRRSCFACVSTSALPHHRATRSRRTAASRTVTSMGSPRSGSGRPPWRSKRRRADAGNSVRSGRRSESGNEPTQRPSSDSARRRPGRRSVLSRARTVRARRRAMGSARSSRRHPGARMRRRRALRSTPMHVSISSGGTLTTRQSARSAKRVKRPLALPPPRRLARRRSCLRPLRRGTPAGRCAAVMGRSRRRVPPCIEAAARITRASVRATESAILEQLVTFAKGRSQIARSRESLANSSARRCVAA